MVMSTGDIQQANTLTVQLLMFRSSNYNSIKYHGHSRSLILLYSIDHVWLPICLPS